ncbi:MAG: hypothetical protein JO356_04290, partial [Acidobacteria bacterium]|nr:hypothetical protein [Acidobacteriota bacterium]
MDSLNLSSKDWTAADLPGVYNPEVQTQPGIGEFSTPSSEFHPSSPRISRWNIVDAAPTALNTACSGTSYMLALLLAARISFGSVRWFFAPKVPGSQLWIFFLLALFWGLVSALVGRTGWGTANKRALFGYLRAEIVFLLGLGEAYALGAKLNVCEAFLVASLLYVLMALILGNAAMHIARSGQLV